MILIYLDESGTNYKTKNGFYQDGPFLIFGSMLVYEDVYWNMERLFVGLIEKYFEIDDWLNNEIHATDIWAGTGFTSHLSLNDRRKFFDEFLQLCGKFDLPYVYSFSPKCINQNIKERNLDIMRTALCLFTTLEHALAKIHQTGVLICDATTKSEQLKIKDIINIDINNNYLSSSQALLKQFHEMTSWRTIYNQPDSFTIPPKYPTETKSVYLIDRVHFQPSDDILFLQMCDIMTFLVQRTLVYDYLMYVESERAKPTKIPCSFYGWSMMREKMHPACYDDEEQDVFIFDNSSDLPDEGILIDLGRSVLSTKIQEQYDILQKDRK